MSTPCKLGLIKDTWTSSLSSLFWVNIVQKDESKEKVYNMNCLLKFRLITTIALLAIIVSKIDPLILLRVSFPFCFHLKTASSLIMFWNSLTMLTNSDTNICTKMQLVKERLPSLLVIEIRDLCNHISSFLVDHNSMFWYNKYYQFFFSDYKNVFFRI